MKEVARFRKQYHKEKEQKETERQDAMKRLKVTTKRKNDSGPPAPKRKETPAPKQLFFNNRGQNLFDPR